MEFNKAVIIGVNYRDFQPPHTSQHLFAEVVVIDKSNDILNPLLYQLNTDALSEQERDSCLYPSGIYTMQDNAFAVMGEVLSIDKGRKIIFLTNNITVSYIHLIIASGLKQTILGASHEEELSGGVHALWEALRVRKNISSALSFPELNKLGFNPRKKEFGSQVKVLRDIQIKNIRDILNQGGSGKDKSLDMALGSTEKRLYELQLGP